MHLLQPSKASTFKTNHGNYCRWFLGRLGETNWPYNWFNALNGLLILEQKLCTEIWKKRINGHGPGEWRYNTEETL